MRAIIGNEAKDVVVGEIEVPKITENELLVKVECAGLNPTDVKHAFIAGYEGAIPGCDYYGIVEDVGENVVGWSKGDRIAGCVHGGIHTDRGSFAEYTPVDPKIALHVPQHVDGKLAACLGVSVTTVGQTLYQVGGLPIPGQGTTDKQVLIWGGSSGTGILAIQLAKLSGCKVITTCSKSNFDYVTSLGADEVFDYNDVEVVEKIRNIGGTLDLALDCISVESSFKACAASLTNGGLVVGLIPQSEDIIPKGVKYVSTLAYTAFGKEFVLFKQMKIPASVEDPIFAAKFWKAVEKLVAEDAFKFWRINDQGKGLENGIKAMKELNSKGARAEKYVFSL